MVETETRIWVQVDDLQGDLRKNEDGSGKSNTEKKGKPT